MISNNSPSSDEDENVQVVKDGSKASRSADPKSSKKLIPKQEEDQSKNACIRFIRNYPIVFVIILSILIICVVLAIVLPLTLVNEYSINYVISLLKSALSGSQIYLYFQITLI